jgi:hypothetical protein
VSGDATSGAGLPLAPPRWTLRPEVAQRVGPLSLRVYYQYTEYAQADYVGHTVGGKAIMRFGSLRVYATGSYRVDLASGRASDTFTAGLGATWAF